MHRRSNPVAVVGFSLSVVVALTSSGCTQQPGTALGAAPSAVPSSSAPAAGRTPSAGDYGWIKADEQLAAGFSITWVAGLTPNEIAHRLGGELVQHDSSLPTAGLNSVTAEKGQAVIGMLQLQDWSMIVEAAGRPGVIQERIGALSKRTTALSTRRDAEFDGEFLLAQNGTVTVDFDPWVPTERRGKDPDALIDMMKKVGFTMPPDPDREFQDSRGTEAAFALIESVTGIPMTRDQIRSTAHLLAAFPDPRYQGPGPVNSDVRPQTDQPG